MKTYLAQVDIFKEIPQIMNFKDLGAMISVFIRVAYILAGLVLLIMTILAGYSIIASAGSGDAKKAASGKKALTNALAGFLIIFASYWIIKLVEKITGFNIISP